MLDYTAALLAESSGPLVSKIPVSEVSQESITS